jgi:glycosyltransferase involved in cell wall biosynthesis
MRIFAFHLTRPANSEAAVLSRLLRHLDDGIEVMLVVNELGSAEDSCFGDPALARHVIVKAVDAGLPLDPQVPRRLPSRLASRIRHFRARSRLLQVARDYRPDLVYTSQQKFDCRAGEIIARTLRVPHVVHLHYTPGPWLGTSVVERLKTCDRLVAISRFIGRLAELHGVDPARIAVVPNTIEVPPEAGRTDQARDGGPFTVGQIGRMAPGKGFDEAILAFAMLRESVPQADLVLVGEGSERPKLEQMVEAMGLGSAVRFVGWQRDVRSWLDGFDVFIHPSRNEPFGLSVLEASAAGVPVVGYDEDGVSEIVVHGETGLLARPGDVRALGNALVRLCRDRELRESMGRAAQARAATAFRPSEAGRAFSTILRTVAGGEHAPGGARSGLGSLERSPS